MLRMMFECTDCGNEGDVRDITNLSGQCPYCGNHHGNIIYGSRMNPKESRVFFTATRHSSLSIRFLGTLLISSAR